MSGTLSVWSDITGEPPETRAWRQQAVERVSSDRLPTMADEHWTRTSLDSLLALLPRLPMAAEPCAAPLSCPVPSFSGFNVIPFVDGRLATQFGHHDEDEAVEVSSLRWELRNTPGFTAALPNSVDRDERFTLLHHALGDAGASIVVRAGQHANLPILLAGCAGAGAGPFSALTNVVVLEAGSSATLVELFNERCVSERALMQELRIYLGAGSRLIHYRLAGPTHRSQVLDTLHVEVGVDAEYQQFFLAAPVRPFRSTQTVRLAGERASAALSAGFVALGAAHVDLRALFIHDANTTRSDQRVSVVGLDDGKATLNCETRVPAGKAKIHAEQLLRALHLGHKTDVSLRPRLSILSDDVVCRHGATTAAVSAQELHYLRSRGLPEREALACLAEGFLRARLSAAGEGPVEALVDQVLAAVLEAGVKGSR